MREFEEKFFNHIKICKTHEFFIEYFQKFEHMNRELLRLSLRNEPRQRRFYKRYMADCQILIQEGNSADEAILTGNQIQPSSINTICLNSSIQLTTEGMIRFINLANELEMLRPEEFGYTFKYLMYLHSMNCKGKKQFVYSLTSDLVQQKVFSLDQPNRVPMFPMVEERRKNLKLGQKLIFDQMEFSQAMCDVYNGLYNLVVACEKLGLI